MSCLDADCTVAYQKLLFAAFAALDRMVVVAAVGTLLVEGDLYKVEGNL